MGESIEAKAKATAEAVLHQVGQTKPFGGPDWYQSEGWPIYAAMRRHTISAILDAANRD